MICLSQGKNIIACSLGSHQMKITSRRSSDEITKQNKRKRMHEDSYKVVGGNNPGWTFPDNNLPKDEEQTESFELKKDDRIKELEELLKLEKDKLDMVSKLIFILFISKCFTNLFFFIIHDRRRKITRSQLKR